MPSKKFASARSTGLIVAGAVALIIAGVVLFVAVSQRPDTPAEPIAGDVTDIDIGAAIRGAESGDAAFQDATDGRLQFEDRDDPRRLEAELIYRRINPVGGGFYELDEPRAWIYMKDGRALFIRADSGRVKMPNRSNSPESGQFVGNVVALLFAPRGADVAGTPRDPMVDAPGLVARTSAIRFDTQLLEFASDDHVTIETPDVRFEGTGVLVRGNQVLDRIEYMRVAREGKIRYRMKTGLGEATPAEAVVADAMHATDGPSTPQVAFEAGWEVVALPDLTALLAAATGEAGALDASAEQIPGAETDPQAATEPAVAHSANEADTTPSGAAGVTQPMLPAAAVAAARAAQAATAVKEDLYEAVFADTVRVTQRKRELAADTLFVWLRTIDNKLPETAFGLPVATSAQPRAVVPRVTPGDHARGGARMSAAAAIPAALIAAAQSASTWPPKLFDDGENDMLLTWAGPMSVKPIAVSPPPRELSGGNHLALRFSSKADAGETFVRLSDAEIGARGGCEELEYLATTRDMTLTSGPGSPRVWIGAPEAGCLEGAEMHVNLATGVAEIPGDGSLATLNEDLNQSAMLEDGSGLPAWLATPKPEFFTRVIDWQRRADFQFLADRGEIRDALQWAEFRGNSFATDFRASLAGNLIRADFVEIGEESTVLKKLSVEGAVEALANGWRRPSGVDVDFGAGGFGEGAMLTERLEVSFKPSTHHKGDVEPEYLLAQGGAIVGKDDASLRAPRLEASLTRDASGEITVTDFEARGTAENLARFDRGDGVRASGDRIKGHAQRQTASVTGPRVQVARGPSIIDTTIVELDGVARTMEVYAPGTFTHEQPTVATAGPESGTVRVTATWVNSMTFDDAAGVLECRGDTKVVKEEPLTLDTVRAERIRVELSTETDAGTAVAEVPTEGATAPGAAASEDLGDRRVLRATAFGSIEERAEGKLATVESRGYAPPVSPGMQRVLETISYIESARLIADDVKGTIETPLAGRAVVFDQRSPDASSENDQQPAAGGVIAGSPRGTSSFRWEKSMVFARATGLLDLLEKIEVVHKPLDARPLTRMTSDALQAKLDLGGGSGGTDGATGGGGRLVYAEAIGSVYAESGPQRLVGDRVMYDARMGTALASSPEGGSVTLYDDRRASPFTARRLKWDLLRDQIEILEPATIVAPR